MSKDTKKDIKELNEELGYVEDQIISIADRLATSVKDAIQDIKDEAAGVADIFSKNLNKSIKDIAKESDKILANTLKLASGEAKISDIQKSQFTIQLKQLSAQRNLDTLFKQRLITEAEKLKAEEEIEEAVARQNVLLKSQLEYADKIQKNMGITGNVIKGISKIPILGNFISAENVLAKAQLTAAKEGSNRTKVMSAAFSELGSSLKQNLTDPLVYVGLAAKSFQLLIKLGASFSQTTADIARNQGVSSSEAEKTQLRIRDLALSSNEVLGNTKNFVEATAALNDKLGTSADFSGKTLEDFTNLTKRLGLNNDEAAEFFKFQQLTGIDADKIVNSIGKQNKGVISNKKVLSEVAKIEGQLFAQYKGSPKLLADAVIQTQKLGISLQQAQNMAKGLLNFEDSISAELEAELLTGRDLNLERARALALQGDSAGAAKELLKQVGSLSSFQKLNVIQQDALAKSVGMTTDELTNSLVKQEQIKKLDQGQVKLYQQQIDELKKKGKTDEANALEKQMLQGKEFELSQVQLSAQERMAAASEKLKDSLSSIIAGPLGKMVEMVASLFEKFAKSDFGKYALAAFGAAGAIALGVGTIVALGKGLINTFKGTRGSSPMRPMYVEDVTGGGGGGEGGGGDITDSLGGGKKAGIGKQIKTLFKKPKVFLKALAKKGVGGLLKGAAGGIGSLAGGLALDYFSSSQMEKAAKLEEEGKIEEAQKAKNIGKGLDIGSSALAGAGIGGTIGSAFFGIGAVPGAAIGAGLGGIYGGIKNYFGDDKKMALGGIVTKPTRAIVGEAGNEAVIPLDDFYKKLDELIAAVKTGGNVYLDGTKVGTAMAVGTYKTQ